MKVYVVEKALYEETWTAGIYSTLERAMACPDVKAPDGWEDRGDGTWVNTLDWQDAALIWQGEVDAK